MWWGRDRGWAGGGSRVCSVHDTCRGTRWAAVHRRVVGRASGQFHVLPACPGCSCCSALWFPCGQSYTTPSASRTSTPFDAHSTVRGQAGLAVWWGYGGLCRTGTGSRLSEEAELRLCPVWGCRPGALCSLWGGGLGASCPCPAPALGCSGCRGSGTEAGKASACSEAKMPFALQPRQEPENWIQEVWPSLSPGAACRPLSAPSPLSLHPCLELSCPLCLPLCSLPEEGLAVAPPGVRGSGRKCCVCSPSTEARTWDFGPGDGAPLAPERPGCQAAVKPVAGAAGPQEAASMCV